MLDHKAEEEGVAVAERIAGQHGHVDFNTIPWVIYTSPEIAWVGQTEQQLKAAGRAYKAGTFPFMANGRARALGDTTGMVKFLADATTDEILGVHIVGPMASELISEAGVAMEFRASSEDIARICHAHPSLPHPTQEAALPVHPRPLTELEGAVNPLDELGERMARRYRLVCFDEFHVADITDAMILHRLLDALFDNGVGFVTTSNFKPDDLYPDGLHRDRVLPAIALLNEKLEVIGVDNGVDYRARTMQHVRLYHTPLGPQADAEMDQAFTKVAESRDEDPVLHIESREIRARRKAGGVVWFDFRTLCGGPRSQNDYLEIATQFHTVLLSDVPYMPVRMASEARRFTWLI